MLIDHLQLSRGINMVNDGFFIHADYLKANVWPIAINNGE